MKIIEAKIIKREEFDNSGYCTRTWFHIKYLKSFFGIKYWQYAQTQTTYIIFKTFEEAENFKNNILCVGRAYGTITSTVVYSDKEIRKQKLEKLKKR